MAPMTAVELEAHPSFSKIRRRLQPDQKGRCRVATHRGGPLEIAYEVHGHGPVHIVWIMGLASPMWYWHPQCAHFGHGANASTYSCLILDNRGMGESDKPLCWYSTSEMARDAWEVIDHVGWSAKKSVHILGVSMGGMIAQEMAYIRPDQVKSLVLMSTRARSSSSTVGSHLLIPSKSAPDITTLPEGTQRPRYSPSPVYLPLRPIPPPTSKFLLTVPPNSLPKSIDARLTGLKRLVSPTWLHQTDEHALFPTNGDYFAAQELTRMKTSVSTEGVLCQLLALAHHSKSDEQLREIGEKIGRERITLMQGTVDPIIVFENLAVLVGGLGGESRSEVRKVVFEDTGHYIPLEQQEGFWEAMERHLGEAEGRT